MTQIPPVQPPNLSPQQWKDINNWWQYRQTHNADGTPTGNPNATTPPAQVPNSSPPLEPSPAYTQTQLSAKTTLEQTLAFWGLSSLGDFAWQEFLKNINIDQIYLDIQQTPQFQQRFPAFNKLAQEGHAMTPTDIVNYEKSAIGLMQAAGLPPGFYDQPDDFTAMLTSHVGLPELQSRIDVAKQAVYSSDPETLAALQSYYGVQGGGNHIGDATAYFLDPDRALPAIQQQFIAAQEGGAAARAGYGSLQQSEAERLASIGVTPDAAQKGFGTLANLQPLFSNLPGEAGAVPTQQQGLAATFEDNAAAQTAISNQAAKRKAQFSAGGGFQQTQGGSTGI